MIPLLQCILTCHLLAKWTDDCKRANSGRKKVKTDATDALADIYRVGKKANMEKFIILGIFPEVLIACMTVRYILCVKKTKVSQYDAKYLSDIPYESWVCLAGCVWMLPTYFSKELQRLVQHKNELSPHSTSCVKWPQAFTSGNTDSM